MNSTRHDVPHYEIFSILLLLPLYWIHVATLLSTSLSNALSMFFPSSDRRIFMYKQKLKLQFLYFNLDIFQISDGKRRDSELMIARFSQI
jgi:hypothetical protein